MPTYTVPTAPRPNLTDAKGEQVGHVIEWTVSGNGLTESDKQALRKKHQSRNVNYERAAEVKRLMNEGRKPREIWHRIGRKPGFGLRMIEYDYAALSTVGERRK